MSAGKGDSPRNNHSEAFRTGWDRVFGKEKASLSGKNPPQEKRDKDDKNETHTKRLRDAAR
jgi:hypothetical protein